MISSYATYTHLSDTKTKSDTKRAGDTLNNIMLCIVEATALSMLHTSLVPRPFVLIERRAWYAHVWIIPNFLVISNLRKTSLYIHDCNVKNGAGSAGS